MNFHLNKKQTCSKNSDGKSSRQLAKAYGIGRTQVQNIVKRRLKLWKHLRITVTQAVNDNLIVSTANSDINDLMWQWFLKLRGQHIPVSGPMMQEKALAIAKQLNVADFKASTGQLHSFKAKHNISGGRICALKWTCHLKHYFLNKGLTKNYDTTVSLESDLQEVISSYALTTKQTTITSFLKIILLICIHLS